MAKVYNGYVKNQRTRLQRYGYRYFYESYEGKKAKHQITYVALDTNIIIDMVHVLSGTAHNRKSPQYYAILKQLLERSVLTKNHTRNKRGDIVFCVTPTVLKELSSESGEIYNCVKNFVNNRTIILQVEPACQKIFNRTVQKMANLYYEAGYFMNKNGEITNDAYITAEASYFNLTLLSRDSHITVNRNDRNPQRKIERIKAINRRCLATDFNGNQAEPRRISNFFVEFEKCKKRNAMMPTFENLDVLHIGVQQICCDINHNQPISQNQYIEKLPNKQ